MMILRDRRWIIGKAIRYVLCKSGFSYKKALMASERERADVAEKRRIWT